MDVTVQNNINIRVINKKDGVLRMKTLNCSEKNRGIKKVLFMAGVYFMVIIAWMIILQFVGIIQVSGTSMQQTLHDGDLCLLNKNAQIEEGDIIVFGEDGELLIKRVIGMPGDTIEIHDGELIVNGILTAEPYAVGDSGNMPAVVVGKDQVFVMGDNREVSCDSRTFGTVSTDAIMGKAVKSWTGLAETAKKIAGRQLNIPNDYE